MPNRCFVDQADEPKVIEKMTLARSLILISPAGTLDVGVTGIKGATKVSLTLAEAVARPLALSVSHLGYEDTFLVKKNRLYASMTPATFHRSGLDAKVSKDKSKYFAVYDLQPPPDRLKWALENTLTQKIDFLVTSEEPEMLKSSAKVIVPDLSFPADLDKLGEDEQADWVNNTIQWIGLVGLNSPLLDENASIDPSISNLVIEGSSEDIDVHRFKGLISPDAIRQIWSAVPKVSWLVLSVSGYDQNPIMWGSQHMQSIQGGEGAYSIIYSGGRTVSVQWRSAGDLN